MLAHDGNCTLGQVTAVGGGSTKAMLPHTTIEASTSECHRLGRSGCTGRYQDALRIGIRLTSVLRATPSTMRTCCNSALAVSPDPCSPVPSASGRWGQWGTAGRTVVHRRSMCENTSGTTYLASQQRFKLQRVPVTDIDIDTAWPPVVRDGTGDTCVQRLRGHCYQREEWVLTRRSAHPRSSVSWMQRLGPTPTPPPPMPAPAGSVEGCLQGSPL
jgi:hypothetical protein